MNPIAFADEIPNSSTATDSEEVELELDSAKEPIGDKIEQLNIGANSEDFSLANRPSIWEKEHICKLAGKETPVSAD